MKITKEGSSINFEFKNTVLISFWEEWSQFFKLYQYNWCNIGFIQVEFETDRQCGSYEFLFRFMGVGIKIVLPNKNKKSKEFMLSLEKQVKTIKKWKTVWMHKEELENLNKQRISAICSLRPEKYKNYKKGYLQINE